jgi:hypothetical protein
VKVKLIEGGVPVELVWLFGCLVGCAGSTYLFGVERLMVCMALFARVPAQATLWGEDLSRTCGCVVGTFLLQRHFGV